MNSHKTIIFAYRIADKNNKILQSTAVDSLSTAFVLDGLFAYNNLSQTIKYNTTLIFEVIRWVNRNTEYTETIAVINNNSINQYLQDDEELQSLLIDCKYYANLLQES